MSQGLSALIKRMEQFPDEFINDHWSIINDGWHQIEPYYLATRWASITELMMREESTVLFDVEVVARYKEGITKILRNKVEEQICKEIVGGERQAELVEKAKQMELFKHAQQTVNKPLARNSPGSYTLGGGGGSIGTGQSLTTSISSTTNYIYPTSP